jgi:D-glycero-alpha-D-manno-heptose-7-phosphate kinase
MIISRTPFRISLFGGGTDHPEWIREHGGAVCGMAINNYCYISVRKLPPFFEHRSRIVWSTVELVNDRSEIKHPAVRAVLGDMNVDDGLEIHHDADLPARSGLGSSSAFTVGLINALTALDGRMIAQKELAQEATRIEQHVLQENVGCQDQVWASYGGLNKIEFLPDGDFAVTPIIMTPARREELTRSIVLFFTGFSRTSSDIAEEQINNIPRNKVALREMRGMVDSAVHILADPRCKIQELGQLLHESWRLKRELAGNISNPKIDEIYELGRKAGAAGGKILGAGGGGFMIFLVDPENRQRVCDAVKDFIQVSVGLDVEGSKIVLYQPTGL